MSTWQSATLIKSGMVSRTVKSLTFSVDDWKPHHCGQFYDVSVDGGKTSRCYSVASAPEQLDMIELGVELFTGGIVSPKLHELSIGQKINISGPHGLPAFTWNYEMTGPLVLVGGGSGVVPLLSMLRHYVVHRDQSPQSVTLISSASTVDDLAYHDEIMKHAAEYSEITYIPIVTQDAKWQGRSERVDSPLLQQILTEASQAYVCGSFSFTSQIGDMFEQRISAPQVHREYFG